MLRLWPNSSFRGYLVSLLFVGEKSVSDLFSEPNLSHGLSRQGRTFPGP
jgi:hypothetical protein